MRYRRNDIGRGSSDYNSCFVEALAVALDTTLADAYNEVMQAGRKRKHATPWHVATDVLHDIGLLVWSWDSGQRETLKKWVDYHQTGTYLVFTCDHCLVVRSGVVIDTLQSRPRCIVRRFCKVC